MQRYNKETKPISSNHRSCPSGYTGTEQADRTERRSPRAISLIGFLNEYSYLCEDVNTDTVNNIIRKYAAVILAALALCLSGCNKVRQINVTSVDIESVSMRGFRGIDVFLAVGIDNPAMQIGLSEINGSLKYSGKVLGRLAMDPFTLVSKSAEIYHLKAAISIEKDAGIRELTALMDKETMLECTVDISVRATLKGGVSKTLRFKDIPVRELL